MPSVNLSNFHKGQSSSPYVTNGAFSKSQNVDVFSQSGIARISNLPVNLDSGNLIDSMPNTFIEQPDLANNFFVSLANKKVFRVTPEETTKLTAMGSGGNYIAYWKSKLLGSGTTATSNQLSYWGSSTTWTGFEAGFGHSNNFMFVSSYDDKVYIGRGQDIAILNETATKNFHPADDSTYDIDLTAFTLPEGYTCYAINEIKEKIVIAAAITISGTPAVTRTVLFTWDRNSTSSDQMVFVPEKGMFTMLAVANKLYVTGGENGNVYLFSESGLIKVGQLPFDLDNDKKIDIGADGYKSLAWWNDELIVGASSSNGLTPPGIWGIKPDGRIAHKFLASNGDEATTNDVVIGPVLAMDENSLGFAWKKVAGQTTTYGLDRVQTSGNRATSYSSYIETLFEQVGTHDRPANFERIDIQLARDLQAGEGIKLYFRESTNDDWTALQDHEGRNITFTHFGAISKFSMPFAKKAVSCIQFRIEMTTGATANTPYLLSFNAPYSNAK